MRRVLFVLTTGFVLAGCGGSNDSPKETTTSALSTIATSTTSTTVSITTSTTKLETTTTNPSQGGEATPEKAAEALRIDWQANSKAAATSVAESAAIDALFRTPYNNATGLTAIGCELNSGFNNAMACSYAYAGGSMHFIMSNTNGKWRVSRVEYIAD